MTLVDLEETFTHFYYNSVAINDKTFSCEALFYR